MIPHKETYLSLAIESSQKILSVQTKICSKFHLHPRPEFHVTLAYFGACNQEQAKALAAGLEEAAKACPADLAVLGMGAAAQGDGEIVTGARALEIAGRCQAVFWLRLEDNSALIELRNRARCLAETAGLDTTNILPDFDPHITLGSGVKGDADGLSSMWDVHGINKGTTDGCGTILRCVRVEKIHVTSTEIHPRSIAIIR